MQFIPSYFKDTTEFINKLARDKTIPPDAMLVTMEVTLLYANVPHVYGVDACSKFLIDHCVYRYFYRRFMFSHIIHTNA